MLGGADNPNGELPSYITGADNLSQSLRLSSPWPVPDILYQLFQRPALSCQLHLCTQPYQLFLPGFGHPFIAVLSA